MGIITDLPAQIVDHKNRAKKKDDVSELTMQANAIVARARKQVRNG
jgi:hypothetical protein